MLDALVIALVAIVAMAVGFLLGLSRMSTLREEQGRHEKEIERLRDAYAGERTRLAERVQYLEFQLANHVAHVLKLPPPAPPVGNGPKPEPLPEVMQKFLDAIEDEEARGEFEGDFRARLALGADAHRVVAEAMSA